MKKRIISFILLTAMLFIFAAPVVYAQSDGSTVETSSVVNTISYVFNAVLAAVLYFVNGAREKSKDVATKVESKFEAAIGFWNTLRDALADEKLTPDEINNIVKAGQGIFK